MRKLAVAVIACIPMQIGAQSATAQSRSAQAPSVASLLHSMEIDATAAFDDEYGRLIVRKLTKAVSDAASPDCVAANKLTPERMQSLVRELLLAGSNGLKDFNTRAMDEAALEAVGEARLGANAKQTFQALRDKPVVKQLFDKLLPGRFDHWVDQSSTALAIYMVLDRIKLKSWHPQDTGDDVEMSRSGSIVPTIEAAIEQAGNVADAETLKTFMAIYAGYLQAQVQARRREIVLNEAPHSFYKKPEFQVRFQALCIRRMQ